MIRRRRVLRCGLAAVTPAALITAPMLSLAQQLVPTKLLVLRRIGLSPTNQCIATCIRGSVYDVTDIAGALDQILLPTVLARTPLCDVIERPWKDNETNVSSIPKGIYKAGVRDDATKSWMNTLNRRWRIELKETAPRTAIQFHYGTDVAWSRGCFIVGSLLQSGDGAGITTRYCKLENGGEAIAALRIAVTATGRDPKSIEVGVVDAAELFPGKQPTAPC